MSTCGVLSHQLMLRFKVTIHTIRIASSRNNQNERLGHGIRDHSCLPRNLRQSLRRNQLRMKLRATTQMTKLGEEQDDQSYEYTGPIRRGVNCHEL